MHRQETQNGFTLLELLVALTLFALIGMGAHSMLHAIISARDTAQQHSRQLAQLQKAVTIMTQDIAQMEPGSLKLSEDNDTALFTRAGWNNPMELPRSSTLQIGYSVQGQTLTRATRQHDATPQTQALISGVSDFTVRASPRLVDLSMNVQGLGYIRRAIEVAEP